MQLIGSIRANDENALVAQTGGKEGEKGARRAVGPVEILEPEQHCRLSSELVEQREQGIEEAALSSPSRSSPRSGPVAELRGQPGELGAGEARETIESRVGRTGERAHGANEGRVGKLVLAELDALTADRADAGRLGPALELRQQS